MGASIARKRTRLGPIARVLRHKLAQGCASSSIMTCFSCAAMVFRYSKRARTFFTWNGRSEVTLLGIPPCQTPMCGVAYSCSYVLLITWSLRMKCFEQRFITYSHWMYVSIWWLALCHFNGRYSDRPDVSSAIIAHFLQCRHVTAYVKSLTSNIKRISYCQQCGMM